MPQAQPADTHRRRAQPRIALALAGGGPLGAMYEIGALCALQECLDDLPLHRCDHYIGVSSGAFITAGLANGITPKRMCQFFIEQSLVDEAFDFEALLQPAWHELLARAKQAPELLAKALWDLGFGKSTWTQALERLGPILPTGLLDNHKLEQEIRALLSRKGRSDDFRQLSARLTLVATDLDSGEAALFGQPGWDHIPISKAITASAALPGLFPPVEIEGRHYADGALKKTLHASVVLEQGVDLLICLNPLVPFHADPQAARHLRIPPLVQGGLPAVMNQTFRSLIHSRLALGMKHYQQDYPETDIVLIEPDHRDAELFLANTFSYRHRKDLAEHAYQHTRGWLRNNSMHLQRTFARHGLNLNLQALNDPNRVLIAQARRATPVTQALHQSLDGLEQALRSHLASTTHASS
jgi:NTE family protein